MDFWKKRQDVNFFKDLSLARKSLKFCKNVVAVWTSFKNDFKHLVGVNLVVITYIKGPFRKFITVNLNRDSVP